MIFLLLLVLLLQLLMLLFDVVLAAGAVVTGTFDIAVVFCGKNCCCSSFGPMTAQLFAI